VDTPDKAVVAAKAIRARTRAYSTISWPSSLFFNSWDFAYSLSSKEFIVVSPWVDFPSL
jgi:hypothetical protein